MSNTHPSFDLSTLASIARTLAEAGDLHEIKAIRDKAEAARKYAQSAALGLKLQNHAAELKLLAERRAGELLAEMKLWGGDRKSNSHDESLKLSELGIDHNQSARWQQQAAVPESIFKKYVSMANSLGQDITSQGLLRLARLVGVDKPHGKVRRKAPRRKGASTCDVVGESASVCGEQLDAGQVGESFKEMKEHQRLLQAILGPFCQTDNPKLKLAEKRMVVRLLSDIGQLMDRIGNALGGDV